jgi:hypothetical protein
MRNIFRDRYLNYFVLSTVLVTFSVTYSVPLPSVEFQAGINEVAFMVRLEQLVEKLKKSESKGSDSMIKALVDIQGEIETSCNVSLDVSRCVDQVGKNLNSQGHKTPKKDLEVIKKKLKKAGKKHKHHAEYLGLVMYQENYQLNAEDELML